MVLTEINISDSVYFNNHMGYNVACSSLFSTVACGAQGGVLMVTRERPEFWYIEYRLFHDPNLVIYKIIPSSHRTLLIAVYLPPSTLDHLPDL